MVRIVPTRTQLGYANGQPAPFRLVAGEPIEVPADLADALLSGGDATSDAPADAPPAPAPRRRRG